VGTSLTGRDLLDVIPGIPRTRHPGHIANGIYCQAGENIADRLHLQVGEELRLGPSTGCLLTDIYQFGGPEDDQIFTSLWLANRVSSPETSRDTLTTWPDYPAPNQIDVIQANIPGTPKSVEDYGSQLQYQFPALSIRPVRQFSETQGKIYSKISGLLTATVVLVLILTALCVLAAMTNVAMERRNDVGLMKAIGGATRRVARLFLTEAALLGLAGGLFGAALGILLSMELGKAVFGVAARPRLIVYPIAVGLTVLVAIVSAYPLRRLASVRPANVFRGEA
jgi:putative ABC transport system permease protein